MDIQTAIDLVEYGGIAASVMGAGIVGAFVTYRRMFGRREVAEAQQDGHYADLSRDLKTLTGRVESLETSVRHLPSADNIIELINTVHGVDRRLAKMEGFVMGKQALED